MLGRPAVAHLILDSKTADGATQSYTYLSEWPVTRDGTGLAVTWTDCGPDWL